MIEQTPIISRTTLLARTAAVRQRTGAYGGYFFIIAGSVMIPNNPLHMLYRSAKSDFARNQRRKTFVEESPVGVDNIHSSSNMPIYSDEVPEAAHVDYSGLVVS